MEDHPVVDHLEQQLLWAALPAQRQKQLHALIESTSAIGNRARAAIARVVEAEDFAGLTPAEQAVRVSAAAFSPPVIPELTIGDLENTRPLLELSRRQEARVRGFEFAGAAPAEVKVTTVTIAGHEVKITEATTPLPAGLHQHSTETIIDALRRMPLDALKQIQEVQLSSARSPTDAFYAQLYGKPDFRAYMNCGADGVVGVFPFTEAGEQNCTQNCVHSTHTVSSTLVHEAGHSWSMRTYGHASEQGWKDWEAAAARDNMALSAYAKSSVDEDIGEATVLYLESRGTPHFDTYRALYPNRFALLDRQFNPAAAPQPPAPRAVPPQFSGSGDR